MDYFYEVKQLIKCTGDFDFHNYIQQFSNQFSHIGIEKPEEFTKSCPFFWLTNINWKWNQMEKNFFAR